MAVEVYLGNPPAHIVQWIKDHSGPAPRAVTRIWWSNDESNFSDCPSNNGTFDDTCFPTGKSNTDAVKVEFGSDVTSIGLEVFIDCSGLTNVTIPNSVIRIEDEAFYNCTNLTSVMIDNGVMSIGSYAFADCSGLTSITVPNSVTSIGDGVFLECSNLTNVTIGNGVTSIGEEAFSYCSELTSVTFLGKTFAQVEEMENYSWGIEDTSIITVE